MKACFRSTNILLPKKNTNMYQWSVVACDQYTSQQDYWENVQGIVKDAPSTYNLIFPEVYLGKDEQRISNVHQAMKQYLEHQILQETIQDGFVLVERETESGIRLGLVGVIDLEDYDFTPGSDALIRATEGTIQSRIPPRLKIREGASIELPHVMVLIDDPQKQLIEQLYQQKESLPLLYDTDLMLKGGHIKGYGIVDKLAQETNQLLVQLQEKANGFFLAVGDGNHSLATAKAYWENIKKDLSLLEQEHHPARYAMVELVNLHSPALIFEPIHRILFNVDVQDFIAAFKDDLDQNHIGYQDGNEVIIMDYNQEIGFSFIHDDDRLPVDILQRFIDDYLLKNPTVTVDYVHGDDALESLGKQTGNCGIRLGAIDKNSLFPAIQAGGVLPRKTFSMGEAHEKRYYMECRKIIK